MSNTITRIPSVATFTKKATAGEYSQQDIADINSLISDKKKKLQGEIEKLEELEILTNMITAILARSIDQEMLNINSGAVIEHPEMSDEVHLLNEKELVGPSKEM